MLIKFRLRSMPAVVGLVLALSLTACGAAVFGVGVAAGLRGLAERTTEDLASDARIRVDANGVLSEEMGEFYRTLGVETYEGRVLLTGTVPEEADRLRAAEAVATVEGVHEVLNEIEVRPSGSVIDYARDIAIANVIRLRLVEQDQYQDKLDFEFEVVNSKVYVIGVVSDQETRARVVEVIRTVAGVEAVVLHLQAPGSVENTS